MSWKKGGIKIDPDDEAVSFLKALEGVNLNRYLKRKECRGRKGYVVEERDMIT